MGSKKLIQWITFTSIIHNTWSQHTPKSGNKITIRVIQTEISSRNICPLDNRKGEPIYKARLQTECLRSIFEITEIEEKSKLAFFSRALGNFQEKQIGLLQPLVFVKLVPGKNKRPWTCSTTKIRNANQLYHWPCPLCQYRGSAWHLSDSVQSHDPTMMSRSCTRS